MSETTLEKPDPAKGGREGPPPAPADPASAAEPPRRRRRAWRWTFRGLAVLIALVVAIAAAGFALVGRPVAAPDWLKSRIEEQFSQQLSGLRVTFGGVKLVVEDVWHPRLHLEDVALTDPGGRSLLTLADIESTLAMRRLLDGEIRPARIWLTGAQLVVRRDASGQIGLSLGGAAREAAGFVQLIEEADQALVMPALAELKAVSANALTIRFEDARAGRVWTVDGGRINLSREGEDLTLRGDFSLLSGGANAATIEMNYASRIGSPEASFGMTFRDLDAQDVAVQSASLLWLNVLRARISGALRGSTDAAGNVGPLSATLQIGAGVLQPTDETKPIPFRAARSYFTYAPDTQTMHFDEMSVDSDWGSVRGDGKVILGALKNGFPEEFTGQMRLNAISVNPLDLYPEPVRFDNATLDMRLRLDPFRLSLGEMTLTDGSERLVVGGELAAAPDGWDLSLSAHLNRLGSDRLLRLWPASLVPRTREWIERNLLDGEMRNVQFGLRSDPLNKPVTYLGWEFSGVETLFMDSMPQIEGAHGHGTLFRDSLTVVAEGGRVRAGQGGEVDIAGTVFRVPDVTLHQAPADVRLRTKSRITAVLSLLDRPPFRFLTKAGLPVTIADGTAEIEGKARFLLMKNLPAEEVRYEARATLRDVRSEALVSGHVLAASELEARADNDSLVIEGEGRIGLVPVAGVFSAPLGKAGGGRSLVAGTVELSNRFVEEFRIGLPSGSVAGQARATVEIEMQRGTRPRFALRSNLAGLALSIPQIGWSLSRGARGVLELNGRLGDPVEVNEVAIGAPGLRASGSLTLGPGGTFREARFSRVQAGSWLDAPVTLTSRGTGAAPLVRVTGGTVDLSQTEIGEGSGSGAASRGGPLIVALDTLRISEGISLTGFSGEFTTARGMTGTFQGRVNGGARVRGQVVPQKGRSAFRITSENAGGVFRSAGLLENARGGTLELTLAPGGGKGIYEGQLNAKSVWLRDAPALAALLNAVSVVGLLEQLSGQGIRFGQVEARFRLTPTQVILARSSAIGTSMGISMDGYYNLETGRMNMQGVVSPFYLLNSVGAVLTRKGEGLIGFSYTLRGTPDKPRVQVNPLSLLTPGMFREIFRRPPPKLGAVPAPTLEGGASPTPVPAPQPEAEPQPEPKPQPPRSDVGEPGR